MLQTTGASASCATLSPRSAKAYAAFRARLDALGATLAEPEWLGSQTPHQVICKAGHAVTPRPSQLHQGHGICMTCAHNDPDSRLVVRRKERTARTAAKFKAQLEQLGATLVEAEWLGYLEPHRVICVAGHLCTPKPNTVLQGAGICKACVGTDPAVAWEAFRETVQACGGTVIEAGWLGAHKPHRVRCSAGHETSPTPRTARKTGSICRICSGRDSEAAWVNFKNRIAELGGTVLEELWLGCEKPHRAICSRGHQCSPQPKGVQQGNGMCKVCTGNDPAASEAKFRARITELGGEVLEPDWLGCNTPHRVRCPEGHEVAPKPSGILQGKGMCRVCKGFAWDAMYVVANPAMRRIKFGVTTGDGRRRLKVHHRAGYCEVVRLLTRLPTGAALDIERHVRSTLRLAGERPEQGYEYFGDHALATVLDIVDNFPIALGPYLETKLPRDLERASARKKRDAPRVDDGLKECHTCHERKALDAFTKHKAGKGGLQASCAMCTRHTARAYYAANHDHLRELNAKWRERKRSERDGAPADAASAVSAGRQVRE